MCVVVEVGLRSMSVGENVANDKQRGVFFKQRSPIPPIQVVH